MARILLVEDEAAICVLLAETLVDAGFAVTDCLCAEEAEAALADLDSYGLLITDVNVGVRGWGFDFARRARAVHQGLAVVYVTGDSEADVPRHGVAGSTVLPKPFLPLDLVRHVRRVLAPVGG
ncbi:response regulator [Phenylobacterium sp.]|uniref:response regulator n=1 Tax=Phenylobacterium sp. TaxID=1871053 RepID=UPI002CD68FE1|nr:response regulator [Phenylobacterium sp.]HVI30842.1 response regulator [Phenylobacterium sp.]